eukprot:2769411-Pleurochrysis_carterae.AAC.1
MQRNRHVTQCDGDGGRSRLLAVWQVSLVTVTAARLEAAAHRAPPRDRVLERIEPSADRASPLETRRCERPNAAATRRAREGWCSCEGEPFGEGLGEGLSCSCCDECESCTHHEHVTSLISKKGGCSLVHAASPREEETVSSVRSDPTWWPRPVLPAPVLATALAESLAFSLALSSGSLASSLSAACRSTSSPLSRACPAPPESLSLTLDAPLRTLASPASRITRFEKMGDLPLPAPPRPLPAPPRPLPAPRRLGA